MFETFFYFFIVFFIGTLIFIILTAVRNYKTLNKHGVDPLAPQADLMGRLANSDLLKDTEDATPTQRLQELEELKKSDLITELEYSELRSKILKEL